MNNKKIQLIILSCFITLSLCISCKQQTTIQKESAEMQKADMQYAYSLLENNKKMEAAGIFEKVIYSNPDNSRAHLELAIIYHQTNDFINAMYHYRKYGKLQPDSQKIEMIKEQLSLAKKEFTYLQNEKTLRRKRKTEAETETEPEPESEPGYAQTNVVQTLENQNIQLTKEMEILNTKIDNLEKTIQSQAKVLRDRQKQISEYTISAGENLEGIALKLYGNEEKWKNLYNANKERLNLTTPNNIKAGQVLIIPWDTKINE